MGDIQNIYKNFDEIKESCPLEPLPRHTSDWNEDTAKYNWYWHEKIPLLETPNGDFIAFDLREGNSNGQPLIYLSHDLEDTHGMRLANNFVEFITSWSRAGCVGPEEWKIKDFYNESANRSITDGELGDRFREIVNEPEPWFPGTV